MLIDGYSLAFRAFYALPQTLTNSAGVVTNALHGFSRMLANLVGTYQPSHMAVAFDYPAPTFREALYAPYKGHRPETPESLRPQLQLLRPLVTALGIPAVELEGFEADDVIGTLSRWAADAQLRCFIVTGDRDSFQLVEDPFVTVLYNRRGVSEIDVMDERAVAEKAGVPPSRYSQYAALRGDPSDNIPGIPGVGEKTAAKLLNEYGDLEQLIVHVDSLSGKLRNTIADSVDQIRLNAELSRIERDVPLDVGIGDLRIDRWNSEEARELFSTLELRGSLKALSESFRYREDLARPQSSTAGSAEEVPARSFREVDGLDELLDGRDPEASLVVAARYAGTPGRSALVGITLSCDDRRLTLVGDGAGSADLEVLGDLFDRDVTLSGVGLKEFLRASGANPDQLPRVALDLAVAEYLVDPGSRSLELDALAERYLDDGATSSDGRSPDLFEGTEDRRNEVQRDHALIDRLIPLLSTRLEDLGLGSLYRDIEAPLIRVLAKMEILGIGVDREVLETIRRDLTHETERLLLEIRSLGGPDLNPNSPKQLGEVLFTRLGLTPGKKNKTGYSTDAQTLERLRDEHPIVELILRYRELDKLRSTFAEGLLAEIAGDGKIHATFHQTVARTGRISSDSPNLHNIPIRSTEGRRFREAFVANPGALLVVADYSQIELRVIAHLSGDTNLIQAMTSNQDVHTQTAALVFGVPPEEVNASQRAKAKMVAYGLAYGMEAFGLGQRLGIPTSEAEEILQAYFAAFPKVRSYMDGAIASARETGFTKTLYGRRRYFADLHSPNRSLRQAAERQAMNAGIQGLAADIFKLALIRLDRALEGRDAATVLQVHDEILVETPAHEVETTKELVRDAMEGAATLDVPLVVNIAAGRSWAEAK
jgi:DNA polymerase-1